MLQSISAPSSNFWTAGSPQLTRNVKILHTARNHHIFADTDYYNWHSVTRRPLPRKKYKWHHQKGLCLCTHPHCIIRCEDSFSMHYTAQSTLKLKNCRTTPGILILARSEEPAVIKGVSFFPPSISSTNSPIDFILYITIKLRTRLLKIFLRHIHFLY